MCRATYVFCVCCKKQQAVHATSCGDWEAYKADLVDDKEWIARHKHAKPEVFDKTILFTLCGDCRVSLGEKHGHTKGPELVQMHLHEMLDITNMALTANSRKSKHVGQLSQYGACGPESIEMVNLVLTHEDPKVKDQPKKLRLSGSLAKHGLDMVEIVNTLLSALGCHLKLLDAISKHVEVGS